MTDPYYPPGYIGTDTVLAFAYYHLFPSVADDDDLLAGICAGQELHDDLSRTLSLLKAQNIPRKKEKELRGQVSSLVDQIALYELVEAAYEANSFDPVVSFFPPFPDFQFINFHKQTSPAWSSHQTPHTELLVFGTERVRAVCRFLQDSLYQGNLQCFMSHHRTGVVEITDRNFWLSGGMAKRALLEGVVDLFAGEDKAVFLFVQHEVEKLFAPASPSLDANSPKSSTVGRRNQWIGVACHLRDHHKVDCPGGIQVQVFHGKVMKEMGETFEKDVFLNARNYVYKAKLPKGWTADKLKGTRLDPGAHS